MDAPVADVVQVAFSVIVAVMAAVEPDEGEGRSGGGVGVIVPQDEHGALQRRDQLVYPLDLGSSLGVVVSLGCGLIVLPSGALALQVDVHQGKAGVVPGIQERGHQVRSVVQLVTLAFEAEGCIGTVDMRTVQKLDGFLIPEEIQILPAARIVPGVSPSRHELGDEVPHSSVALDFLKGKDICTGVLDRLRQSGAVGGRVGLLPGDVEVLYVESADRESEGGGGEKEDRC